MTKGNANTIYNRGYSNMQHRSWMVENGSGSGNNHQASRTVSDQFGIPTDALNLMHATYCSRAPTFPGAPAPASGYDWPAIQGEEIHGADQMSGYIFMCNGKTKIDCYMYRVFGLPSGRLEAVEKIKPHMRLFLFDFESKFLYGVYTAASTGQLAIEPNAFGGKFPAQVRFEIFKECLPLPESAFKHVIKDNYMGGSKFKQELNDKQVVDLISLFRPLVDTQPASASSLMGRVAAPDSNLVPGQFLPPGLAHDSPPVRQAAPPFSHIPHSLTSNVAGLLPAADSLSFLQKVPQPQSNQLFREQTHLSYFPPNSSLRNRETFIPDTSQRGNVPLSEYTYRSYTPSTVASNALVQPHAPLFQSFTRSLNLTPAYWAQVAAGATYSTVPANGERETTLQSQAHSSMSMQFQTSAHGPVDLPSSSYPASYWAGVAAAESLMQRDHGADTTHPSSFALGPSGSSVPESSVNNALLQFNTTHGHHHNSLTAVSSAYVPSEFSSEAARYWTTTAYHDSSQQYFDPSQSAYATQQNIVASNNDTILQTQGQVPSQFTAALPL